MPVLYYALVVAVAVVLFLRKARFHFERIPKIPYVAGAEDPEPERYTIEGAGNVELARVFFPSAVRYMEDENVDQLLVILKNEPRERADRALAPYAMALSFCATRADAPPFVDVVVRREGGGGKKRVARAEHMGKVFGRSPYLRMHLASSPLVAALVLIAAALFATWLPLMVLLTASGLYRQAALFAVLPSVLLFPWYRSAMALAAPVAIYLIPLALKRQAE